MAADYYELLGVARTASADELKKAYRKRAREFHPDANPDDVAAAERFKEVARAYQVLSDPDLRSRYDRFGEQGVSGAAGPNMDDVFGGGLGDLFETFFGGGNPFGGGRQRGPAGPPRGQDMEVVADIPFETAVFGGTVPITLRLPQRCADCDGAGAAPGTEPVTCSECNGRGQVQRVRQSLLGQMVTSAACGRCGGLGQVVVTPCPTCRGEGRVTKEHTYQVDVPAGVDSGSTLRLGGRGAAGPRGGGSGDLYVHLRVGAATSGTDARATTSSPMCPCRSRRPRSARPSSCRPSTATRSSTFPRARSRVVSSCCGAGAYLVCRAAAGAICGPVSRCRCPPSSIAQEAELLRSLAEHPGRVRPPGRQGPLLPAEVGVLLTWTRACGPRRRT